MTSSPDTYLLDDLILLIRAHLEKGDETCGAIVDSIVSGGDSALSTLSGGGVRGVLARIVQHNIAALGVVASGEKNDDGNHNNDAVSPSSSNRAAEEEESVATKSAAAGGALVSYSVWMQICKAPQLVTLCPEFGKRVRVCVQGAIAVAGSFLGQIANAKEDNNNKKKKSTHLRQLLSLEQELIDLEATAITSAKELQAILEMSKNTAPVLSSSQIPQTQMVVAQMMPDDEDTENAEQQQQQQQPAPVSVRVFTAAFKKLALAQCLFASHFLNLDDEQSDESQRFFADTTQQQQQQQQQAAGQRRSRSQTQQQRGATPINDAAQQLPHRRNQARSTSLPPLARNQSAAAATASVTPQPLEKLPMPEHKERAMLQRIPRIQDEYDGTDQVDSIVALAGQMDPSDASLLLPDNEAHNNNNNGNRGGGVLDVTRTPEVSDIQLQNEQNDLQQDNKKRASITVRTYAVREGLRVFTLVDTAVI